MFNDIYCCFMYQHVDRFHDSLHGSWELSSDPKMRLLGQFRLILLLGANMWDILKVLQVLFGKINFWVPDSWMYIHMYIYIYTCKYICISNIGKRQHYDRQAIDFGDTQYLDIFGQTTWDHVESCGIRRYMIAYKHVQTSLSWLNPCLSAQSKWLADKNSPI